MDLIFADETRKDVGILSSYSFDMAFGDDENDFECVIDRNEHCCKEGYFLYVDGEEYGGIIDQIRVSTEKDEVTYCGRTWHGILENKIISPEVGQDYAEFEGEANQVLSEIIERIDLTDLFEVPNVDSGIDIAPFQMERYTAGYTGIRKMLRSNDAKLKIFWKNGKVNLYAVNRYDYSQDDEFDTSQVDFEITRNFKPVNHLICLGKGDLQQRAIIHLFTDENGGLQPYKKISEPLQDSDYILDESQKLIFGSDEIMSILDYSNADVTTNYILLQSKPEDWNLHCEKYFYRTEITESTDESDISEEEIEYDYKEVERKVVDIYWLQSFTPPDWSVNYPEYYIQVSDDEYEKVPSTSAYVVQTKKPSDWKTNYEDYFIKSGGNYNSVASIENEKYTKQNKKPSDWKKNYSNYFVFYSDGVTSEYQSVSGITKYKYAKQTRKPTDWNDNYKNYYKKKKSGGYKKIDDKKCPKWKAKKYYTQQSYSVAPKWQKNKYFTQSKTVKAPDWITSKYYTKYDEVAPAWERNKYYTKGTLNVAPKFVASTYYYAAEDRYAALVESGISKLEEMWKADELTIDLAETDQSYDIDDIVGASDHVTGIETIQEVVKKIIKIVNDDITITYEVS